MSQVMISKEELMRLHMRYLMDTKIAAWINQIASLYSRSIPKGLIKKDGAIELFYPDEVEVVAEKINEQIGQYIKENYPELIYK